jgi:hypothetical protein
VAIAAASDRYGMGPSISATALIYLGIAILLLWNERRYMAGTKPRIVDKVNSYGVP